MFARIFNYIYFRYSGFVSFTVKRSPVPVFALDATTKYQWRVGRTTICKFVPQVCKAILKEFQHEYLMCPTDPEDWKKIEERFRNRWNVPHAVGALDGNHIAIKKPKKSGSEYFNYKGYFSLVLLALVDADYKYLWVNMEASGSSSDAQIFNHSKLKKRIENGTLGLPPPEPLGPGGPDLHYFLLGDDAFALMPWLVKPYSRQQLTREERIANYRISGGEGWSRTHLVYLSRDSGCC